MIGIDMVHIPTFIEQLELGGEVFLARTFQAEEMKNSKPEHLAGLWAAKEAVMKATGLKINEFLKIVIHHQKNGQPIARVGTQEIAISITHHGDYAVAVAFLGSQMA
jgi:phosphopantetheine--protein transferase-like protein